MKRSVMKSSTALAVTLGLLAGPAFADMEAAKKFLDEEIERSALSREEQEAHVAFLEGFPRRAVWLGDVEA